jgi:hypothetical protein
MYQSGELAETLGMEPGEHADPREPSAVQDSAPMSIENRL